MIKTPMTHEEVNSLLHDGYDVERGWKRATSWNYQIYNMWRSMWYRCYDVSNISYKYYIDSIIHDDFRYLSNFIKWIETQPTFLEFKANPKGWSVDKDMKVIGNKNYYPEFMSLVTRSENSKDVCTRNPAWHSKDSRAKASKSSLKPIIGIHKKDSKILLFKSTKEATEKGFTDTCISNCLNRRQKSSKGYKWYYINYKHNKVYRRL